MIEFDFDSQAWSMATMFNFWPQGNVRFVSESDKVTKKESFLVVFVRLYRLSWYQLPNLLGLSNCRNFMYNNYYTLGNKIHGILEGAKKALIV